MRTIKKIHDSEYRPIADLITYSPMPSARLQQVDPFIFLNHHGPQEYPRNNHGLPFGPHPHRGMETVTFIIDGDIMHKDSGGHESIIQAGGIQWMTAGSGLIHAEVSSDKFKKQGGKMEILQLWLNLPAKHKMAKPFYKGLQKNEIPTLELNKGKIRTQIISGNWWEATGAFESISDISLATFYLDEGSSFDIDIPVNHNVFFHTVRGHINVNGGEAKQYQLVEFENDNTKLSIGAKSDSIIILGHAKPFNEPMVAQGPFVMNTQEEIQQAYRDYQNGKFGSWNH